MSNGNVELIPGTSLPVHTGPGGFQPEGRGDLDMSPDRQPVSIFQKLQKGEQLSAEEAAMAAAAIRAYDRGQYRFEKFLFETYPGQTDATTGNCVIPMFQVPQGMIGHLTTVIVDTPGSATITPSAPFASASSWAFVATGSPSSAPANSTADTFRSGALMYAPTSAGGPILPGQWGPFGDDGAPLVLAGRQAFYVLHGGSIAGLPNIQIIVKVRVNLFSFA